MKDFEDEFKAWFHADDLARAKLETITVEELKEDLPEAMARYAVAPLVAALRLHDLTGTGIALNRILMTYLADIAEQRLKEGKDGSEVWK